MDRESIRVPRFTYTIKWGCNYLEGGGHMGVAIDSLDNIVVCGITADEKKGVIIKYDADGTEVWADHDFPSMLCLKHDGYITSRLAIPPLLSRMLSATYGYFFDLAIDSDNNIVAVGTFISESGLQSSIFVKKYRPDGTTLWERTYKLFLINLATSVAVDRQNDIYIVGGGSIGTKKFKAFIMKLSGATGRCQWKRTHGDAEVTVYNSLTVDATRTAYAVGLTSSGNNVRLTLASYGGMLGRRLHTFIGSRASPASITLVSPDCLIIAGKKEEGKDDQYLLSCTRRLKQQWELSDEISGFLYGTTVMEGKYIVATGARNSFNSYYAGLYDLADGHHLLDMDLGQRVSNRIDDYLRGIAIDNNGDLVLVGARTLGKTIKISLQEQTIPPFSPVPPQPDFLFPPDRWITRLIRWLSDLF